MLTMVIDVMLTAVFGLSLQQLRANLREMEKLCGRVRPEDGPALQQLVTPIRERALAAAQDFLLLHSNPAPCPRWSDPSSTGHPVDQEGDEPPPLCQAQLCLPVIPAKQNAAESWDSLEEVRLVDLLPCLD